MPGAGAGAETRDAAARRRPPRRLAEEVLGARAHERRRAGTVVVGDVGLEAA